MNVTTEFHCCSVVSRNYGGKIREIIIIQYNSRKAIAECLKARRFEDKITVIGYRSCPQNKLFYIECFSGVPSSFTLLS